MRKVTLSTFLASLGVVAEADGLAIRCSIGALLELLSAFVVLALAVALSTLALVGFLQRRLLCSVSVPGLRPLSVKR